jgi:CHASE3 domain sensor protein
MEVNLAGVEESIQKKASISFVVVVVVVVVVAIVYYKSKT